MDEERIPKGRSAARFDVSPVRHRILGTAVYELVSKHPLFLETAACLHVSEHRLKLETVAYCLDSGHPLFLSTEAG